jgi:hypothetical protein
MKFTPVNQNFIFEPINTPNKYIQSYFMRNEQSFFTRDSLKYPEYIYSPSSICFLVTNKTFHIDDIKIEQDFIIDDRFNLEKYGTRQKCIDGIYTLLHLELFKLSGNRSSLSSSEKKVEKMILIFNDFLGRSDLISLIDIFLNSLNFKCILILPLSLSLSFQLNQPFSAFIYKNGFSFVEDFCLLDTFDCVFRNEKYSKISADDFDFAEEYSRLNVLDENLVYSCDECGHKEDLEEKIRSHCIKEHSVESFFKFESSNKLKNNELKNNNEKKDVLFRNRMRFLFKKETVEKFNTKVYTIAEDSLNVMEKETVIGNYGEMAISGAITFSNLEIAKELFMTDCEWRIARLRILKEKILFYI